MSKSLNNVVDPTALVARYGADPIRFFLLREGTFGLDADFSHTALIHRINSELANDLGNLFNRSLAMTVKYFQGVVPRPSAAEGIDERLQAKALEVVARVDAALADIAFHKALEAIWELVALTNKYIEETAPWTLAKNGPSRERLATVIYDLLESLRFISVLLFPFMPSSAERMWEALGMTELRERHARGSICRWGETAPGTTVTHIPQLFPRIEE